MSAAPSLELFAYWRTSATFRVRVAVIITPRVRKYLSTVGGFDDAAVRAWMQHWFSTGLAAFEQRLAAEAMTGRFCDGDQPTIADICLASIVAVTRLFKMRFDGLPTVDRIMAECDALDAFARAAPLLQQGAPAE